MHSTDGGVTCTQVDSMQKAVHLGFGKAAPGRTYPAIFATGIVGETEGLFRSDDQGRSWIRIDDELHGFGGIGVVTGDPRVYGRVYLGTTGRGIFYGDIAGTRH